MTVQSNRFYNDPNIGAAFENIASMFAPPSAQDTAAYATAAATRAKEQRIAELFANPTDPNFDRRNIAVGNYAPTQSFYAVDQNTATTRRGQDVTASTSLQTNAADNARAIREREMQEAGMLNRQRDEPLILNEGQTAVIPPARAQASGLADFYAGNIVAAPGERITTPDGRMIEGAAKPLSESEVKGAERKRLAQSGLLTDRDLIDAILGDQTPVEAIGPSGAAVYMTPGAAVRSGAAPAPRTPLVNVQTGEAPDGKLRGKLDEAEGKRWSDLQAAATTASGLQQDLGALSELVDQVPSGAIVGRLAELFPEATTAGAAFSSIVSRAAPGLRVEGSGATSDIEYNGMVRSLPRLRNSPEANRLIVDTMRAKSDVNIRRGEIISAYQNGDLDASAARSQLTELNRVSIMSPELKAMIGGAVGAGPADEAPNAPTIKPGTIEDGFLYRGGDPADPANWEAVG